MAVIQPSFIIFMVKKESVPFGKKMTVIFFKSIHAGNYFVSLHKMEDFSKTRNSATKIITFCFLQNKRQTQNFFTNNRANTKVHHPV